MTSLAPKMWLQTEAVKKMLHYANTSKVLSDERLHRLQLYTVIIWTLRMAHICCIERTKQLEEYEPNKNSGKNRPQTITINSLATV